MKKPLDKFIKAVNVQLTTRLGGIVVNLAPTDKNFQFAHYVDPSDMGIFREVFKEVMVEAAVLPASRNSDVFNCSIDFNWLHKTGGANGTTAFWASMDLITGVVRIVDCERKEIRRVTVE